MEKVKTYKHIFFDLDHTLWDYNANAKETLEELFDQYQLGNIGHLRKEDLVDTFYEVNEQLWDDYNHDRIQKGHIREKRFQIIFDRLGVPLRQFPYGLGEDYLFTCPTKTNKIPYAQEVLEYLKPNYKLHVITNGFNDIQTTKLESSGLAHFFDVVITSESIGARKPSPKIFEYALSTAKASLSQSIMIGDNLSADVLGARNYGIDQIYYNPSPIKYDGLLTHEISCLSEIKDIL